MTGTAALEASLQRLWPGCSVEVGRGGAGRNGAPSSGERFVAVPSARSPRFLLPENRGALAAGILRHNAAISAGEAAARSLLGGLLWIAGPALLRDRVVVSTTRTDDIAVHLGEVLGRPVRVGLGIGTDRVNRKPVLQVFDHRGRTAAWAKVGDTPVAAAHVRGEAAALADLGGVDLGRLRFPEVLWYGQWQDMPVLVIGALHPQALQRKRRSVVPAALELARAFPGGRMPLAEGMSWRRWTESADGLTGPRNRDRLVAAIERGAQRWGDRELELGGWHGDFTPWNMGWRGARLEVWDWERFETGVPVGIDVLHFEVQRRVRERGLRTDVIAEGIRAGNAALGPDGGDAEATAVAYLVAVAVRYLVLSEGDGGGVIAGDGAEVLAALEELVAAPS